MNQSSSTESISEIFFGDFYEDVAAIVAAVALIRLLLQLRIDRLLTGVHHLDGVGGVGGVTANFPGRFLSFSG